MQIQDFNVFFSYLQNLKLALGWRSSLVPPDSMIPPVVHLLESGLTALMLKASLETAVQSGLTALMLKASLETAVPSGLTALMLKASLEPKKYIE